MKRRKLTVFSISFIDCICCGLGAIILLGGLGYALDKWLGSSPWGTIVGLVLGIVVGFYELVKTAWHK